MKETVESGRGVNWNWKVVLTCFRGENLQTGEAFSVCVCACYFGVKKSPLDKFLVHNLGTMILGMQNPAWKTSLRSLFIFHQLQVKCGIFAVWGI